MNSSMPSILRIPAAVALLCACAAGTASEDEKRAHDVHVHGQGLLNVAVDGDEMAIELEVPGVNVVGFEHAPETDEQKRAIREALESFARGGTLFLPTAEAGCRLEHVEVSLGDEHAGGDAHEKREHEEKAHGNDGKEEADSHAALLGEYHFHCDEPDRLHGLEVRIFEHLKDLEELDVQIVTPTVQAATELEPGSTVLKLTD